jgi:hypothetical protein
LGSYSSTAYLESLSEYGAPISLPSSGAGFLEEQVGLRPLYDARGAYPLLCAADWDALAEELEMNERKWVSVVAVPDPLTAPRWDVLADMFTHVCRPYKEHFVVELDEYEGPFPEGHRRSVRRAASLLQIERVEEPITALADWLKLYNYLIYRHDIKGIARFSRQSFERQLATPGLIALRAKKGNETVGMTLWLREGDRAYYHLGASNQTGYESGASFGLFAEALAGLKEMGVERVLLGGGSTEIGEERDGLARFKAGWATTATRSFLCGRIFDMARYEDLSRGIRTEYFPAYRVGGLVSAAAAKIYRPFPLKQAA